MTVEELQIILTANTSDLRKEISKTNNTLASLERNADKTNKGIFNSFKWLKRGIMGLGLAAVFGVINKGMDAAISRLDTLNNYPRSMSNLGIGAADAQRSIDRLSDGLAGLPTKLDDAALSVQRFTSANGNIKASTEMFLALNNAILAGGAPIGDQASALEQLSQAYAKGKPDMFEWRAAMTAMPAQLKQLADSMGYVNADALGEDLRSGAVSMNDFMLQIMRLNKEGVNGFQSFEDQARNSTGGVATGIANMRTAISRGIANILNVIGQANIAGFFNAITRAINATIPYIAAFVKVTMMAVQWVAALFGKGAKQSQSMAKSVGGASVSMGNLAKSSGGASKGIDKTTGAAKKLKKELKGLAGFDELHVMDQPKDDAGGGAGGLGGLDDVGAGFGGFDDFDFGLDEMSDGIDAIAEKTEKLLSILRGVGDFFKEHKVPIIATIAALGAGFAAFKIAGLIPQIVAFFEPIMAGVGIVKLWVSEMGLLKGLFDLLITTVGTTGLVIGAVVLAIAAFVGAIVQLWQTNEEFRDAIKGAWNEIANLFKTVYYSLIKPILDGFVEMLVHIWTAGVKPLWDRWVEFVGAIVTELAKLLEAFLPIVTYVVSVFFPIIADTFRAVFNAISIVVNMILEILGTMLAYIGEIVAGMIQMFRGFIDFFVGIFTGDWQKALDGVGAIFEGWFRSMSAVIGLLIEGFMSIIKFVGTIFVQGINVALNVILSIFKNVFGAIFNVAKGAWDKILGLFSKGGKIFDGIKAGIANVFTTIVNGIINGINKVISIPFQSLKNILSNIKGIKVLGLKPFNFINPSAIPIPQIPTMPAYEKGTNFVPEDGWAYLHRGEEVKPAKQGKPYRDGGSNDDKLITLLLEINANLVAVRDKDTDVYLDTDKITKAQNLAKSRRNKALGLEG